MQIEILVKNILKNIPIKTGIVTIKNICIAISKIEIEITLEPSVNKLREIDIIIGIVITHNKLIMAVKETDKATSPLAKEVIIFDVAPPGAAAINITPIASSGDKGQIITSINATTGKMTICDKAPRIKSFGCLMILIKSSYLRLKPSENIINAKANGKKISEIIPIIYNTIRFLSNL